VNHYRLRRELEEVAVRFRQLRCWSALAIAWLVTALAGTLLWATGLPPAGNVQLSMMLLCGLGTALAIFGVWLARASVPSHISIARRIESAYPELESRLLAALEQRPELPDGRYGFLQYSVICEALEHADRHSWPLVVSPRRLGLAIAAQFTTFTLFLVSVAAAALWAAPTTTSASTRASKGSSPPGGFEVVVEPGDVEIERGTSLPVMARIRGQMPAEAMLVFQTVGGEVTRMSMTLSLNDPIFGARIASVTEPLEYHVELDGAGTPTYRVKVFEYPRLERADVRLNYPSYTGLDERLVQDVRTVSVVEGTEVTVICRLNKPVATARLTESRDAPPVELVLADGDHVYQATIRPEKSRRWKLELVDDAGRQNVQPAELAIQVIPNQPPVLKVIFPARDVEVSALEELETRLTAWDDFGLIRVGVTYSLGGQPPADVILAENAAAQKRHNLAHLIRLEELVAEPDQLLTYHFWGEDFGPDGSVRRTMSEMFFAEVRHFDDIYRQGQPPPGGQQQPPPGAGQNAQAAQKLAELQKEIINATWKLIRRESGPRLTDAFADDAEEITFSQAEAHDKAVGLAGTLKDAQSLAHLATVLEQMNQALSHLKTAHEEPALAPLTPALAAEQAAYQALLKLRAREFEVVRQRGQSGSGDGQPNNNRNQRPGNPGDRSDQERRRMQDLELTEDENRYETQRQAQPQEDRETRQVLNRLSELARRQHDLNERVKDLQSALAEAATPPQREEAGRQLERLEEEQEQVLRDTDELKTRMESPENQERMSEEKQQLEEARDQVQRSLEALNKEKVTQAAASGTRAESEFEELRNEFRRRAARPFSDDMQHIRQAARELDRREKQLGERLKEEANPGAKAKSLREDGQREEIEKGLAEQRQRLTNLVERMRQTIQEAEQTEPLLSERLYDAARNVQNRNLDQTLQAAEGAVRRGMVEDAQKQEQAAGRGISQLREGVERAAESILGDETEALRRARDELRTLTDELNREIARNTPGGRQETGGEKPSASPPDEKKPSGDNGQSGEGQTGEQSRSEQPGTGRPNGKGKQSGESEEGSPAAEGQSPGQAEGQAAGKRRPGGKRSSQPGARPGGGGIEDPTGLGGGRPFGGSAERVVAPIAGNDYLDWSDRLRDVEEMVDDPELRAEAARIRDRARGIRAEVKRHSAPPNWDVVRVQVAEPLVELGRRVSEELLRQNSRQAVVPLDRDPVPPRYTEKTRRYYEKLGSGK